MDSSVPRSYCRFYGADAAAIAAGIAMSIILKATPLTNFERRIANIMTPAPSLPSRKSRSWMIQEKHHRFDRSCSAIFQRSPGIELLHIPISRLTTTKINSVTATIAGFILESRRAIINKLFNKLLSFKR